MKQLREDAPAFWALLDEEVRNAMDSIIESEEKIDEFHKKVKEQLTQTTYENMRDNFISALSDMSRSASDFANDFSSMLFKAVLNAKVNELFNDRLEKWYDQFADAMEDGEISESERRSLLNDYNAIVDDGLKLRDTLADVTGYSEKMGEGSGAYKSASSFSQDQGDELNGRLAAIQIGQQQGIIQRAAIMEAMMGMTIGLGEIQSSTRHLAGDISAMRDMQYSSLQRLSEISAYTSVLPAMASDMADMRNDIRNKL